jgi:hypothetical protein
MIASATRPIKTNSASPVPSEPRRRKRYLIRKKKILHRHHRCIAKEIIEEVR